MITILGVILTFILTIVIGNRITQSRQLEGWLVQQRFSGQEKEYLELKTLSDQIASSINIRVYAMRRLARQLRSSNNPASEKTISDYQDAVKSWNENISSYYVRLSQLHQGRYRHQLEEKLHNPMRIQSEELDKIIEQRSTNASREINLILKKLDEINLAALIFNEHLLDRVCELRNQTYFPKRVIFSRNTMQKFSTWQLIKAIFLADVNSMSILRSPLDP